jgi:hypothetical protein
VLVEIANAGGARGLAVTLNGRDVTTAFRPGGNPDSLLGLVTP